MVPYLGLGLCHVSDCMIERKGERSPVRAEPQPDAPIFLGIGLRVIDLGATGLEAFVDVNN